MSVIVSQRETVFKACPSCGRVWTDCEKLLEDPDIRLLGFQRSADETRAGMLLFQHRSCGTSLAVSIKAFEDVIPMPVYSWAKCYRTPAPEFCSAANHNIACPLKCTCEFAYVLLFIIQTWRKNDY
jgi:hypothetical protein